MHSSVCAWFCDVPCAPGQPGIAVLENLGAMRLSPSPHARACAKRALLLCWLGWRAFVQAQAAEQQRDFRTSEILYTGLIDGGVPDKAPLYASLYSKRANAHHRLQDHEAALRDCAKALCVSVRICAYLCVSVQLCTSAIVRCGRSTPCNAQGNRVRQVGYGCLRHAVARWTELLACMLHSDTLKMTARVRG